MSNDLQLRFCHCLATETGVGHGITQEILRAKLNGQAAIAGLLGSSETAELTSSEIAMFILPNALITVRKDRLFDIDKVVQRWDDAGALVKEGVGFLLYGVLDYIVDGHFEAGPRPFALRGQQSFQIVRGAVLIARTEEQVPRDPRIG